MTVPVRWKTISASGFALTDPHDKRASRLQLTAAGMKLVPKLAEAADRTDRAFFSAVTAREQSELLGVVKKLVETHHARIDANE